MAERKNKTPRSGLVELPGGETWDEGEAAAYTDFYTKKITVTTAGTPVPLSSGTLEVDSVTIKALSANTGIIKVQKSGSATGTDYFELSAKDSVSFNVTNLNSIYIDATVSGEGVTILAVI